LVVTLLASAWGNGDTSFRLTVLAASTSSPVKTKQQLLLTDSLLTGFVIEGTFYNSCPVQTFGLCCWVDECPCERFLAKTLHMYTHVSNNAAQTFTPGCGKEFYQLQINKVLKHTLAKFINLAIFVSTQF